MLNSHCQELIQLVYQCSSTYTVVQQKHYCTEVSRSKFALVLVPPSPLLFPPFCFCPNYSYQYSTIPSLPSPQQYTLPSRLCFCTANAFTLLLGYIFVAVCLAFFCCCMSSFILVWGTTMFPLLFDLKLKGNFCCLHVRR